MNFKLTQTNRLHFQGLKYAGFVVLLLLNLTSVSVKAQVAINPPFSMPDVNIIQVGDRAYAFCGTDVDPYTIDNKEFLMPYWRCFSSSDLVNWEFESMLDPKNLYMGKSDKCFAGHGTYKNGKWYWYFSDYHKSTGVAVADSPKGPWKDALGKPILPEDIADTREYDNCVFIDDDGKAYMTFGNHKERKMNYYIVPLNNDMISLKAKPQKIEVLGNYSEANQIPVDASFLSKHNGKYYLSWRRPYAVADNVMGPYHYLGHQDAVGHGGFFEFNNQTFVNYTSLKDSMRIRYRFSSLAYVHYKKDGTIAPMEPTIKEHGVGQYDANWPKIEAEWFMAKSKEPIKTENKLGNFEIQNIKMGDYINYPYIHNMPQHAVVEVKYSCGNKAGGKILLRADKQTGPLIGESIFSFTGGWDNYSVVKIPLYDNPNGTISLSFNILGDDKNELIRIESFKIIKGTERVIKID